jgi:hypothetical protein
LALLHSFMAYSLREMAFVARPSEQPHFASPWARLAKSALILINRLARSL